MTRAMLIDLDAPAPAERVVRRRPRYAAPAVVALLLALIGAEAAPPRAAELVAVTAAGGPVTAGLLTPDALYTEQDSELRAQPLVPGGPQWTRALFAPGPELALLGDTLIVYPGAAAVDVLFLDVRTGRARWQAPWDSRVAEVAADRVVVWEQDPAGVVPGRLRLADLATGRAIWSRVADGGALSVDRPGGRVVSVNYDGVASVHRLADGRPIVEGVQLAGDRLAVVGDQVLRYDEQSVTAYGLGDLRRRWQTRISGSVRVTGCGAALCVSRPAGLAVLDPATGRVRWQDRRWVEVAGLGLLSAPQSATGLLPGPEGATEPLPGPENADEQLPAPEGATGMLSGPEGATGLLSGAGGQVAQVELATGRVLRAWPVGRPVGDLMLSPANGRTMVARFADGRTLGTVPPVDARLCRQAGPYLACRTAGRTVTVWPVRS